MRLFQRIDREEGQVGLPDSMFAWGKVYYWDPYKKRGNVASHYFCFMFPWTCSRETLDYATFNTAVRPCRWRLMWRKHLKSGKVTWHHAWIQYQ